MDLWGLVTVNCTEISENTGMGVRYDIIPETVGQYTGLTDKNGKKIFEGDIVKHNDVNYKIKYFEKYTQFAGTRDKAGIGMVWFNFNTCEVIGNIHDNPDLIGGNDKDVII